MHNRLLPIIDTKRQEVDALYRQVQQAPDSPLARMMNGSLTLPKCLPFKAALSTDKLAIIAEIKRRSPSKGHLATIPSALALAKRYAEGGASAISILTDTSFFGGHLSDLQDVASHFRSPLQASAKTIPLLRKDFIIDPIQLAEARLAGADAVLAIVAVLGKQTSTIITAAKAMGLDVLVEAHTEAELELAVASGADLIGVNNRDLNTMLIDTEQALRLRQQIPEHICKVAESGILVPELAKRYRQAEFDAVLIGEALVTTDDPQHFMEACRDV